MYRTLFLSVATVALITGCSKSESTVATVGEVGTFSGCRVEYVDRGGASVYNFYIAHCPGDSTTTTRLVETRSGKYHTVTPSASITTTEDPRDLKIRQLETQLAAIKATLESLK